MVLDEYNPSFLTNELQPGVYTFKDLFEVLSTNLRFGFGGDVDNAIDVVFDDDAVKTKLVVGPLLNSYKV